MQRVPCRVALHSFSLICAFTRQLAMTARHLTAVLTGEADRSSHTHSARSFPPHPLSAHACSAGCTPQSCRLLQPFLRVPMADLGQVPVRSMIPHLSSLDPPPCCAVALCLAAAAQLTAAQSCALSGPGCSADPCTVCATVPHNLTGPGLNIPDYGACLLPPCT